MTDHKHKAKGKNTLPRCPQSPCQGCGLPKRMSSPGGWVCGNRQCTRFKLK